MALRVAGPSGDLADRAPGIGADVDQNQPGAVVDALSGQPLLGQFHEPSPQEEEVG
jgi:hypothetical protein